jgi:hypothetical protein
MLVSDQRPPDQAFVRTPHAPVAIAVSGYTSQIRQRSPMFHTISSKDNALTLFQALL